MESEGHSFGAHSYISKVQENDSQVLNVFNSNISWLSGWGLKQKLLLLLRWSFLDAFYWEMLDILLAYFQRGLHKIRLA